MKRRKQGNRALMEKHMQERQRNLDEIARLTARNEELSAIIAEEEKMIVVEVFLSTRLGLDAFCSLVEGRLNGGVPFPMTENPNKQEETIHEV